MRLADFAVFIVLNGKRSNTFLRFLKFRFSLFRIKGMKELQSLQKEIKLNNLKISKTTFNNFICRLSCFQYFANLHRTKIH